MAAVVANHVSGLGGAVFRLGVCVRTRTFELHDILPSYLTSWFTLTLSRSSSKLRSQGENVAKVVGATSGEDFLLF